MPRLTPALAFDIAKTIDSAQVLLKQDGSDHLKYAYRVAFPGVIPREISIVRKATEDGVTVYLNKQSCTGDRLDMRDVRKRFSGARVLEEYPKGHVGKTGGKGISSAAGGCPSLLPLNHDVLRVSCSDADGFRDLVSWYAGGPASVTSSAVSVPVVRPDPRATPMSDEASLPAAEQEATDDNAPGDGEIDVAGRLADPAQRRAVELRAVAIAKAHYEGRGFDVKVLGKPFDLLCIPTDLCESGSREIHVEVKGSVSSAASIHLTRNEIADARQEGKTWRSDLFIASSIELRAAGLGAWEGFGGEVLCVEDWHPEDKDLEPTDYVYRVPRDPTWSSPISD